MRRNSRVKSRKAKTLSDKIIMYSVIGIVVLTIILVGLLIYSKSLSDDVKNSTMSLEKMASIAENNTENTEITESASTERGKTVEESKNETNNTNTTNTTNMQTENRTVTSAANNTNSTKNTIQSTNSVETKNVETKKELSFIKPVDGEIVKEYAKDNLIYSETLKEWVTHLGIDIQAEKTTVVKAAETGTIKTIKNDPRYGLTIVIEHEDGFQTVYSNLLTSEFVVEGEKVEKGQSIGTVGNTAVFEIADEAHLHFEILKDSIQVDPNIYIK